MRKKYPGGKETPEQLRLRKQRRIARLYGGDGAAAARARRKREIELAGRSYNPRGTIDEIAKRVQIKRLIKILRRHVRALKLEDRRQHRLLEAEIQRRRKQINDDARRQYRDDPRYAIYHRIKRSIHKHLGGGSASIKWSAAVGWTMDELRAHLERQFKGRMSWRNKGKWHIDHIRPVASFSFTSVDDPQFRECYALANLRPLWKRHNLVKNAKRTHLL